MARQLVKMGKSSPRAIIVHPDIADPVGLAARVEDLGQRAWRRLAARLPAAARASAQSAHELGEALRLVALDIIVRLGQYHGDARPAPRPRPCG
jgi:hypothetical protein